MDYKELNDNELLYLCCENSSSNDIQMKQFKNVDDIIYKLNLIKKLREGWETL